MQVTYSEPFHYNSTLEVRYGQSSWEPTEYSVKFTWFTSAGKAARGGEVPAEATSQMFLVAARKGAFSARQIAEHIEQASAILIGMI
jgi:hypothetical protein